MKLHRLGRAYYRLTLDTDPAVDAWEASFDDGVTWHASTPEGDGVYSWLLAGKDAPIGTAVAVITTSLTPIIRALDAPEIIVEYAPRIALT